MSGDWDWFTASWGWSLAGSRINWYVEGPAPINAYALPKLPQEVLQLAPDLVREDFLFRYMRVEGELQPGVTQSQAVYPNLTKNPGSNDTGWPYPHGLPPHVQN